MLRIVSLRRQTIAVLALIAGLPLAASCSDEPLPSGGTTAASTTGAGGQGVPGVEAHFELPASGAPAFLDVPFPTDLYRDASGRVGDIPGIDAFIPRSGSFLVSAFSSLDGFGTSAGALFRIDDLAAAPDAEGLPAAARVDVGSLPRTEDETVGPAATVMLIDLEAPDASTALVRARVDYRDDRSLGAELRPLLVIYPARGVVLAEGRRYAAVVTTGVRTEGGAAVQPSATLRAIADGSRRLSDAEKSYGDAIDKVAALVPELADTSRIAGIAVYTTHRVTHELLDLRAEVLAGPAPALAWDAASLAPIGQGFFAAEEPLPAGFAATLDAWLGAPATLTDGTDDPASDSLTGRAHDAIAALGTAVFDAPNVLLEQADGYADATHRNFARDARGRPIVNPDRPTSRIWATIALPKGAVPAAGFPTVMVQHGLGGDRSYLLALANTFARQGWATVAIDSVTFGARARLDPNTLDEKAAFPWSTNPGAYSGPDGLVDERAGPNDFFGNLQNLGALRDQMRQSVLDLGTLADVIRDPALDLGPLLDAVPGARLDGDNLVFLGDSLGGIMGALFAAIEPNVRTFVLNVAGAGLLTELGNGPYIAGNLRLAGLGNFGIGKARFAAGHPLVQLIQHIVGPGDPLLYAHHIVTDPATINGTPNPRKSVLQIEVLFDEIVCNEGNEALARAAGFPLGEPSTGARAGIPLGSAAPVGGSISGVPFADVTAVLMQVGPATHGSDLHDAIGRHAYHYPWGDFDADEPFVQLDAEFALNQPYVAVHGAVAGFFASAFAGGPPEVAGLPAPTLDYDGDGALDADDAEVDNPDVQ